MIELGLARQSLPRWLINLGITLAALAACPNTAADYVIRSGETLRVELAAGDPATTGVSFDLAYEGDEPLTVDVKSIAFDTVVESAEIGSDGDVVPLDWDNDGGAGTNSRLSLKPRPGGRYRLTVRSGTTRTSLGSTYGFAVEDWGGSFEITVREGWFPAATNEDDETYWATLEAEAQNQDAPLLLARALMGQAKRAEIALARSMCERAHGIFVEELGADHPAATTSLLTLAVRLATSGRRHEAKRLAARISVALATVERRIGADHQYLGNAFFYLGWIYLSLGNNESAKPLFEKSLRIREFHLGADHFELDRSLYYLAEVYRRTNHDEEARRLLHRLMAVLSRHPEPNPLLSAYVVEAAGSPTELERSLLSTLREHEEEFGRGHPTVASDLNLLGYFYLHIGEYIEARDRLERALLILNALDEPNDGDKAASLTYVGEVYHAIGLYDEAVRSLEQALALRHRQSGRSVLVPLRAGPGAEGSR